MSGYGEKRERLRRRTLALLALATAIGSAGLAAGGTAGALLGAEITGTDAAAGLPLGVLVVGQVVAALLVSNTTGRVGRDSSLAFGYALGVTGAVLVILAAVANSIALLLAVSTVLGSGNTAVFLAGYAAADIGGDAMRGRAIGTVLFAAALGAVVSPNLLGPSGELARLLGLPPLTGLYVIAVLCFSVAALLLAAVSNSGAPYLSSRAALLGAHTSSRVSQEDIIHGLSASPTRAALAILAATNLVMVDGRGHGDSPRTPGRPRARSRAYRYGRGHPRGRHARTLADLGVDGGQNRPNTRRWSRLPADRRLRRGQLPHCGRRALYDRGAVDARGRLELRGGWGSTLLAASVPTKLRPHVEGLGEVSMGLATGAGAPVAGLVVALGGFAALTWQGPWWRLRRFSLCSSFAGRDDGDRVSARCS